MIDWSGSKGMTEASEMDWGVGQWPFAVTVPVPGHKHEVSFERKGIKRDEDGDVLYAWYESKSGYVLTVFND